MTGRLLPGQRLTSSAAAEVGVLSGDTPIESGFACPEKHLPYCAGAAFGV